VPIQIDPDAVTALAARPGQSNLLGRVAKSLPRGGGGETVTALIVKGLISRDAGGALALTDRGRAVLQPGAAPRTPTPALMVEILRVYLLD
jgi:hypothetical protein